MAMRHGHNFIFCTGEAGSVSSTSDSMPATIASSSDLRRWRRVYQPRRIIRSSAHASQHVAFADCTTSSSSSRASSCKKRRQQLSFSQQHIDAIHLCSSQYRLCVHVLSFALPAVFATASPTILSLLAASTYHVEQAKEGDPIWNAREPESIYM